REIRPICMTRLSFRAKRCHGERQRCHCERQRSNLAPGTHAARACFVAALLAMTWRHYDDGRFILQVVGSVSSATVVLNWVFHPRPVFSTSYFTSLVNTAS